MKTYHLRRRIGTGETAVTVHPSDGLPYPLPHFVQHSPDGFEWGYGGSGPSELARCVLIDHLGLDGSDPELQLPVSYQEFKAAKIATIEADYFEITSGEITGWIAEVSR